MEEFKQPVFRETENFDIGGWEKGAVFDSQILKQEARNGFNYPVRPYPGGILVDIGSAYYVMGDRVSSADGALSERLLLKVNFSSVQSIDATGIIAEWFKQPKSSVLKSARPVYSDKDLISTVHSLGPGFIWLEDYKIFVDNKKIADARDSSFGSLGRYRVPGVTRIGKTTFEPNPEGALLTRRFEKSMFIDRYVVSGEPKNQNVKFNRQEFLDREHTKVVGAHWHPQGILVEHRDSDGVSYFVLNDNEQIFKVKFDKILRHPQGVVTFAGEEIRLNGALLYKGSHDHIRLTDHGIAVRRGEDWRIFVPTAQTAGGVYR